MSGTGITIEIEQPSLTIEVTDTEAIIAAGNFYGIQLETLNVQGPAGQGAFQYVHDQPIAATVWTINHNLNGYPNVTAVDSGGTVVHGTVDYVSANQVTITHATPYAGSAYLT